jgi:hypothetical protein
MIMPVLVGHALLATMEAKLRGLPNSRVIYLQHLIAAPATMVMQVGWERTMTTQELRPYVQVAMMATPQRGNW